MNKSHLQQRLSERGIENLVTDSECWYIAKNCKQDSAVILTKLDSHIGTSDKSYYARTDSNGDLVVLIVRENRPVTIMYRRSSQTNTPAQLRVNEIIDLTN